MVGRFVRAREAQTPRNGKMCQGAVPLGTGAAPAAPLEQVFGRDGVP